MLLTAIALSAALLAADEGDVLNPAQPDGSELVGNYVSVSFGSIRNKLLIVNDRIAVISSENGVVTYANWSALQGRLCLELNTGSKECWPYTKQFVPGRAVQLVSGCGASSSWTLNQRTD